MPFAGGAQAENESQRAGRQTGLIGVRNDGGIEQRGRFQGVFGEEVGADQQPSLFGELPVSVGNISRTCSKRSRRVCGCADGARRTRRRFHRAGAADLLFGKRQDPFEDPGDAL